MGPLHERVRFRVSKRPAEVFGCQREACCNWPCAHPTRVRDGVRPG
jgi:hypothetical protein